MTKNLIATIAFIIGLTGISIGQNSILKLEDIWANRQFYASGLSEVRSMKDGLHYTELAMAGQVQCIVKNELSTGKTVDTILRSTTLSQGSKAVMIEDYQFSENEEMLLVSTEVESIYRHSTKANNIVVDLKTGKSYQVSKNGKQQYAAFSPTNENIAFVRDNNIFLFDLKSQSEKQITIDGKRNEIINGATDWVYEEEFSFDQAYQWSPDGKNIAFYRFDERDVKEFNLTYYGELYPKEEKYKYPKAGEANSKVEIYIYNVANNKAVKTDVNKEADQYIPRIKWTADAAKLCIMRMNRRQNKLELYSCDAVTGAANVFFTEVNNAYIEVTNDLHFLSNKKEFVWTSTIDGYNHIYLYEINGKLKKQITSGKWDVTAYYGMDEKGGNFYFQAAMKSPIEKGVYSCNVNGKLKVIIEEKGTNDATFITNYQYYFITNSGLHRPQKVTLYNKSGKIIRIVEDNKDVIDAMNKFSLTAPEFFSFTTNDSVSLNGWMIKPLNFDKNKKYPVIQYMYGGPNSQTVTDEWSGPNYFWFQMLAQKGYLIVSVDNRGTGARGEAFNKCIYKQLGKLETIDQIEVAKWLGKQSYVDASRIGSWGWSYGGYMTSLLMTKGADYFKVGVAVAPVTNWKFYDTIYTERYLQTPQLNPQGYEDNSPINFTKQMKGKYLLIHGAADDNVHMQNSMEMVTALVKDKKQFDIFYYPNKAHGISGVRLHLFEKMTNYFLENL